MHRASIPIDLVEECIEEGKRSAHDRSKVLASTAAYFRTHRGEPVRLQGTGTRHFYIVESGSIDSAACLPATRAGDVCIVSNGLKTILQEKGKAFLLHVTTAKAPGSKTHELHYSISLLDDATGEPVHTERGSDFSRTWKNTMFHALGEYKERPGFILKERKLQDAYMRQVQRALGDAYSAEAATNELKRRFLEVAVAAPPPPAAASAAAASQPVVKRVHVVMEAEEKKEPPSSGNMLQVWRACLPKVVLDHEGAQFEWWKKQPGFERTLRELVTEEDEDGDSFVVQLNLGIFLYGTGQFAQALQHFRNIEPPLPDTPEAVLLTRWKARSYMKNGDAGQAETLMQEVLAYYSAPRRKEAAPLELSLSYSDLAWVFHDQANKADSSNQVDKRRLLALESCKCFSSAIELREKDSASSTSDTDSLRLLADDYYGKTIMLLLFQKQSTAAQHALQRAEELTLQVYGGKADCESDVMSRIHRGRGVLEIKRARECDAAEARHQHFQAASEHLGRALQIRVKVMGARHPQVANLNFLLAEVKEFMLMGLETNKTSTDHQELDKLRSEVSRLRSEATEIWNENGVAKDHAWRTRPRELTAQYIPMLEDEEEDQSAASALLGMHMASSQ